MSAPVASASLQRARTLLRPAPSEGGLFDWSRVSGRVVECSESSAFGALSALCGLLLQVQNRQESIVWIETGNTVFFPPDLAFRGVDVEALTVVFLPDPKAGLLAADWLLRSGAFGLLVVDWAGGAVEEGVLGRLSRLAEEQMSVVFFLTRKTASQPSLGSQVSLRGWVERTSDGETRWSLLRDKRSGPLSAEKVVFHGPFGVY